MTPKLFSELGLSAELLKAIDKLGFEQAAPIQAEAIPILMQGRDVVGQSQTGSGKTAAFAVPAIEKVDPDKRATQVLILCPTRELAVQVSEEVHKLALFKRGVHALPIYGGQSYERQLFGLKQGAHIVIGTPGRVMDHMRRATLRLDSLKMVILDEVDVMLNMGFRDDIELILQSTPKERQTVVFSATIPRPIQDLIKKYTRDPQSVKIEQKAMTVPTVEQVYYEVDRRYKIELLTRLIDIHDLKLGIIFCNTKRMVDDLVDHLNAQGYSADRLHGDMNQAQRDRVMNKFRKSGLEFLVATDVAARGIDVDDIEVVFNYDLPYDGEDYVHRIGRTGRAGRSGRAISFAAGREVFQIRNIERYTNTRIQRGKPPTAGEVEEARANVFLGKVRATLKSGEFKSQEHFIERLLEEGFTSTDVAAALLHHLQTGEAAPAVRSTRDEEPSRPERPSARDRREDRFDRDVGPRERAPRYEDRPPRRDERPSRPNFSEERPKPPARPPAAPPVVVKPVAKLETPKQPEGQTAPQPPRERPARPERPSRPAERRERPEPWLEGKAKASRRTPGDHTRLFINVGAEMGVAPGDVVGAILGETGLPSKTVGVVDIRERHLFVDVAAEHANAVIAKMNRAQIKGRRLKVKVA
jgi:ATP-dependent RNA helicase DeaD